MANLIAIWDFDWSLIDENSDLWILNALVASPKLMADFAALAHEFPVWTDRMDQAMRLLHDEYDVAPERLLAALAAIPFSDDMIEAVKVLHDAGARQIILSDANSVFIDCILRHRDMHQYFERVITNPAAFDANGRLHVRRHQPIGEPHGCARCPAQLCKGDQVDALLAGLADRDAHRVLYVGDGKGDLCPSLRLRRHDVVFARAGYPLEEHLAKEDAVAATVVSWASAQDALQGIRRCIAARPAS